LVAPQFMAISGFSSTPARGARGSSSSFALRTSLNYWKGELGYAPLCGCGSPRLPAACASFTPIPTEPLSWDESAAGGIAQASRGSVKRVGELLQYPSPVEDDFLWVRLPSAQGLESRKASARGNWGRGGAYSFTCRGRTDGAPKCAVHLSTRVLLSMDRNCFMPDFCAEAKT